MEEYMPTIANIAMLVLQIIGPVLTVLISAVVWRLLGKLGIEKNIAVDTLIAKYVKQGINHAEAWSDKQVPGVASGENKLLQATNFIIDQIDKSKLPKMATEKLQKLIEAQLIYDKKK